MLKRPLPRPISSFSPCLATFVVSSSRRVRVFSNGWSGFLRICVADCSACLTAPLVFVCDCVVLFQIRLVLFPFFEMIRFLLYVVSSLDSVGSRKFINNYVRVRARLKVDKVVLAGWQGLCERAHDSGRRERSSKGQTKKSYGHKSRSLSESRGSTWGRTERAMPPCRMTGKDGSDGGCCCWDVLEAAMATIQ